MSELKPCPFCGCSAKVYSAESWNEGGCFWVGCFWCHADTDFYSTEAKAIEAWNRRANDDAHM